MCLCIILQCYNIHVEIIIALKRGGKNCDFVLFIYLVIVVLLFFLLFCFFMFVFIFLILLFFFFFVFFLGGGGQMSCIFIK